MIAFIFKNRINYSIKCPPKTSFLQFLQFLQFYVFFTIFYNFTNFTMASCSKQPV